MKKLFVVFKVYDFTDMLGRRNDSIWDKRIYQKKYWKKGNANIAILGIENQVKIDKYMPFRMIGYDGASYRSQLLDKRKNIVPVVSLVLYFGTKRRWNKRTSIKECIDIQKGLDIYINDYKVHVIEVAWLTDEQLNMFKGDFGIVANFFVQKRRNKNYRPDDPREIKHVDEVLKLLSVMTGDKKYESILYSCRNNEEVKSMCEVAQHLIREGREEGAMEVLCDLVRDNLLSIEEAAKRAGMTIEEFENKINGKT